MRTSTALAIVLTLPACVTSEDLPELTTTPGTDTTATTTATDDDGSTGSATDDDTTSNDDTTGPGDATATTDDGDSTGIDPTTGEDGSSTGGPVGQLPPTNEDELIPWLEEEIYTGWNGESGPHPSAGPHFDGVWTFVNDALYASLEAGNPTHPEGAAAVKELFNAGGTRLGWAVEVKIQPDSAGGDGWYWYEVFDGNVFADGTGQGICTGCHGGGTDYVLTPFPLQ